jgi:hypothetical protein
MADVNPVLFVPGEIRKITEKRDFTDKVTGEFRPGRGRHVEILTYGGFLTVSVGADHDGLVLADGDVILWKVDAMPWFIRGENGRPDKQGTAYVYTGPVTDEDLKTLPVVSVGKVTEKV